MRRWESEKMEDRNQKTVERQNTGARSGKLKAFVIPEVSCRRSEVRKCR